MKIQIKIGSPKKYRGDINKSIEISLQALFYVYDCDIIRYRMVVSNQLVKIHIKSINYRTSIKYMNSQRKLNRQFSHIRIDKELFL